jgi:hypothetical protein
VFLGGGGGGGGSDGMARKRVELAHWAARAIYKYKQANKDSK